MLVVHGTVTNEPLACVSMPFHMICLATFVSAVTTTVLCTERCNGERRVAGWVCVCRDAESTDAAGEKVPVARWQRSAEGVQRGLALGRSVSKMLFMPPTPRTPMIFSCRAVCVIAIAAGIFSGRSSVTARRIVLVPGAGGKTASISMLGDALKVVSGSSDPSFEFTGHGELVITKEKAHAKLGLGIEGPMVSVGSASGKVTLSIRNAVPALKVSYDKASELELSAGEVPAILVRDGAGHLRAELELNRAGVGLSMMGERESPLVILRSRPDDAVALARGEGFGRDHYLGLLSVREYVEVGVRTQAGVEVKQFPRASLRHHTASDLTTFYVGQKSVAHYLSSVVPGEAHVDLRVLGSSRYSAKARAATSSVALGRSFIIDVTDKSAGLSAKLNEGQGVFRTQGALSAAVLESKAGGLTVLSSEKTLQGIHVQGAQGTHKVDAGIVNGVLADPRSK